MDPFCMFSPSARLGEAMDFNGFQWEKVAGFAWD
jgi:hypothetical protein